MGGLLTGASLFLKIDEAEWMVFEDRRDAGDITRKYVELVDTRGSESEEPSFGFDLLRF